MFNGSRFFNLAKRWKKEEKDTIYFFILQDVMDHYLGCIAGYQKSYELIIKGSYSVKEISFVLDAVGYYDYSIEKPNIAGNRIVTLRNQL